MNNTPCPYLGQEQDETTAFGFPSQANYCYKVAQASPVNLVHQQTYCLTGSHTECPVYRAARPAVLPAPLRARRGGSVPARRLLALIAVPILALLIAAMVMSSGSWIPKVLAVRDWIIPSTGQTQVSPPFGLFPQPDQATFTPFVPGANTPTLQGANTDCPAPSGWVPYVVNPTDSLFRLSVVYGASVEALQAYNCLGENTVILPGQVIYVPYVPTFTPTFTPLVAQYEVYPTSTQQVVIILPPADTPIVAVPPTNTTAPPTAIPPTNTFEPTITLFPTHTPIPPTVTTAPSITVAPTNTPVTPTNTPRTRPTRRTPTSTPTTAPTIPPTLTPTVPPPPTATEPPPPTTTSPPLSTATDNPTATSTEPLIPTATEPPPAATDPPEPTFTDVPPLATTEPPQPTATDPPQPTATSPPEPSATEPQLPSATSPPEPTTEPAQTDTPLP